MVLIGEHTSVAEELLFEVPELEQKCRAVQKSVLEGYFNLGEALVNYKVREIEYIPYLLLKTHNKLKKLDKQHQVFDTINIVMDLFMISTDSFDLNTKKALLQIKKISEKASSTEKHLTY